MLTLMLMLMLKMGLRLVLMLLLMLMLKMALRLVLIRMLTPTSMACLCPARSLDRLAPRTPHRLPGQSRACLLSPPRFGSWLWPSGGREAAIYREHHAGDVGRCIGGQKRNRLRHFIRMSHAPQGHTGHRESRAGR